MFPPAAAEPLIIPATEEVLQQKEGEDSDSLPFFQMDSPQSQAAEKDKSPPPATQEEPDVSGAGAADACDSRAAFSLTELMAQKVVENLPKKHEGEA